MVFVALDVSPAISVCITPADPAKTEVFNGVPTSCFPASTGIGSSFDVELVKQFGEALTDECRAPSKH